MMKSQEGLSGKVSLKLRPTEEKALTVRRHVEEHVRPRKQQVNSLQEGGVAQSGTERKGASDGAKTVREHGAGPAGPRRHGNLRAMRGQEVL